MKNKTIYLGIILALIGLISIFSLNGSSISPTNIEMHEINPFKSEANAQFIESLLDKSITGYQNEGYFSSYYQPTLQATYQALTVLDAIGGLSQIDEVAITDYIMEHYTVDHTFIDDTALRYMDGDFDQQYYPLLTHLEVTCYAVLALDLLDQLSLINTLEVVNFIWSCYQPDTSGFIGTSYSTELDPKAKISTMDNIYYALMTLETLGFNWDLHPQEKSDLINFISTSQAGNGGFFNDKDYIFDSLDTYEPGLFSSFYAMHSLKLFNMHESIRINDFKNYLANLYNPSLNYFSISEYPYYPNETNVIASAIGLELSDLVSFTGINREALVNFILSSRDGLSGWSSSTTVQYHELIDSFQIIRSLKNAGELSSLSYDDQAEIGEFIAFFKSHEGYAPLPPENQAISQLYTLATSAKLVDRVSDLPLQYLYDSIEGSLLTFYVENGTEFAGATNMHHERTWFRSNPIEFATRCSHQLIPYLNSFSSIKWTSLALDALDAIYKLDDLPFHHNLTHLLNGVINSQFLSESISNLFGGFINSIRMERFSESKQIETIFLENAYYAIRVIEKLSSLLQLNRSVGDLLLDDDALNAYIGRNMIETDEMYFKPRFGNSVEDILEHTYQAIYILRTLGKPDANLDKIEEYVTNHLDEQNLQNIYYCYKIAELYEFEVNFDISKTQALIQTTYDEDVNNFYSDIECDEIEPQAYGWIIEMGKNDDINVAVQMKNSVMLGDSNNITVSIGNMVMEQLGSYATVKFHSHQLGAQNFIVQSDGTHLGVIAIPVNANCFPEVLGNITVYDGLQIIKNKPISFKTTYGVLSSFDWKNYSNTISLSLNVSLIFGTGKSALTSGSSVVRIYRDGQFLRSIEMNREDKSDYSEFTLTYIPLNPGIYLIDFILSDGYNQTDKMMGEISFSVGSLPELNPNPNPINDGEIALSTGLIIGFISIPGTLFYISRRLISKSKESVKF